MSTPAGVRVRARLLGGRIGAAAAKFHAGASLGQDRNCFVVRCLREGVPLAFLAESAAIDLDVTISAAVLPLAVPIAAARFRGTVTLCIPPD